MALRYPVTAAPANAGAAVTRLHGETKDRAVPKFSNRFFEHTVFLDLSAAQKNFVDVLCQPTAPIVANASPQQAGTMWLLSHGH